MGRVKSRQEAANKRAQREDTIQKALNTVETMNKDGNPKILLREASKAFGIPFSTLQGRWNGTRPHFVAHQKQQILTGTDEKAVVWWIRNLENCGFAPKVGMLIRLRSLL